MWPFTFRFELGNQDGSYHEKTGWTQEVENAEALFTILRDKGREYGKKGLCVLGVLATALTLTEAQRFRERV